MGDSPLRDLNLKEWMDGFDVYYVDDPVLEEHVAVHALTTYGKKNDLHEDEIWIHLKYERFERELVHHEAIENYLRRLGWSYERSHAYALRKDLERFGGTKKHEDLKRLMRTHP